MKIVKKFSFVQHNESTWRLVYRERFNEDTPEIEDDDDTDRQLVGSRKSLEGIAACIEGRCNGVIFPHIAARWVSSGGYELYSPLAASRRLTTGTTLTYSEAELLALNIRQYFHAHAAQEALL